MVLMLQFIIVVMMVVSVIKATYRRRIRKPVGECSIHNSHACLPQILLLPILDNLLTRIPSMVLMLQFIIVVMMVVSVIKATYRRRIRKPVGECSIHNSHACLPQILLLPILQMIIRLHFPTKNTLLIVRVGKNSLLRRYHPVNRRNLIRVTCQRFLGTTILVSGRHYFS